MHVAWYTYPNLKFTLNCIARGTVNTDTQNVHVWVHQIFACRDCHLTIWLTAVNRPTCNVHDYNLKPLKPLNMKLNITILCAMQRAINLLWLCYPDDNLHNCNCFLNSFQFQGTGLLDYSITGIWHITFLHDTWPSILLALSWAKAVNSCCL